MIAMPQRSNRRLGKKKGENDHSGRDNKIFIGNYRRMFAERRKPYRQPSAGAPWQGQGLQT